MLSISVEYALRAMMYLASLDGVPATCETIAARTQVPQGYLSKVMRGLVCADLARSFRGPNGGFCLARAVESITLLDVVSAVDPVQRIRTCPLRNPLHTHLCPLHQCLDDALAQLESAFRSTSLGAIYAACLAQDECRALPPIPLSPQAQKDSADVAQP